MMQSMVGMGKAPLIALVLVFCAFMLVFPTIIHAAPATPSPEQFTQQQMLQYAILNPGLFLASACSVCEDTSAYNQSNFFLTPDETNHKVQIALSYGSSRTPVKYAPIIVRRKASQAGATAHAAGPGTWPDEWQQPVARFASAVHLAPPSQTEPSESQQAAPLPFAVSQLHLAGQLNDTGDFYVTYTGADGLASFDFSQWADTCQDYQFFYCYAKDGCGLAKCFAALGLDPANVPYSSTDEIPLAPGLGARPAQPQDPALVTSNIDTYSYCPPAPDYGTTTPAFCLPLVLIFALLAGALFMSGKNPFGLFDFSTARMGKHFRYIARGRGFGFDLTQIAMGVAKGVSLSTKAGRTRIEKQEKAAIAEEKARLLGKVALVTGGLVGKRASPYSKGAREAKGKAMGMNAPVRGIGGMFRAAGGLFTRGGPGGKSPISGIAGLQGIIGGFRGKGGFWAKLGSGLLNLLTTVFRNSSLYMIFMAFRAWGIDLRCYGSTQEAYNRLNNISKTLTINGVAYRAYASVEMKDGKPVLDKDGKPVVVFRIHWGAQMLSFGRDGKVYNENGKQVATIDSQGRWWGWVKGKSVEIGQPQFFSAVRRGLDREIMSTMATALLTFQFISPIEAWNKMAANADRIAKMYDTCEKAGGSGKLAEETIKKFEAQLQKTAVAWEEHFPELAAIIQQAKSSGKYELACALVGAMPDNVKAILFADKATGAAFSALVADAHAVTLYAMTNTNLGSQLQMRGQVEQFLAVPNLPAPLKTAAEEAKNSGNYETFVVGLAAVAKPGSELFNTLKASMGEDGAKLFVQNAQNMGAAIQVTDRLNAMFERLDPKRTTALGLDELRTAAMNKDYARVAELYANPEKTAGLGEAARFTNSSAGDLYQLASRAYVGDTTLKAYAAQDFQRVFEGSGLSDLNAALKKGPEAVREWLKDESNAGRLRDINGGEAMLNTLSTSANDLQNYLDQAKKFSKSLGDYSPAELQKRGLAEVQAALASNNTYGVWTALEKPAAFEAFTGATRVPADYKAAEAQAEKLKVAAAAAEGGRTLLENATAKTRLTGFADAVQKGPDAIIEYLKTPGTKAVVNEELGKIEGVKAADAILAAAESIKKFQATAYNMLAPLAALPEPTLEALGLQRAVSALTKGDYAAVSKGLEAPQAGARLADAHGVQEALGALSPLTYMPAEARKEAFSTLDPEGFAIDRLQATLGGYRRLESALMEYHRTGDPTSLNQALADRNNYAAVGTVANHNSEMREALQDAIQTRAQMHLAANAAPMLEVLERMRKNADRSDENAATFARVMEASDSLRSSSINSMLNNKDAAGLNNWVRAPNEGELAAFATEMKMGRDEAKRALQNIADGWQATSVAGNMGSLYSSSLHGCHLAMGEQAIAAGIPDIRKQEDLNKVMGNFYSGIETIERDMARMRAEFNISAAKPWMNSSAILLPMALAEKLPDSVERDYYRGVSELYERRARLNDPEARKGQAPETINNAIERLDKAEAALTLVRDAMVIEKDPTRTTELMFYARAIAENGHDTVRLGAFQGSFDNYMKAAAAEAKATTPKARDENRAAREFEVQKMQALDSAYSMKSSLQQEGASKLKAPALEAAREEVVGVKDAKDLKPHELPEHLARHGTDAGVDKAIKSDNPFIEVGNPSIAGGGRVNAYEAVAKNFDALAKRIRDAKSPEELKAVTEEKTVRELFGAHTESFKPRSSASRGPEKLPDEQFSGRGAGGRMIPIRGPKGEIIGWTMG